MFEQKGTVLERESLPAVPCGLTCILLFSGPIVHPSMKPSPTLCSAAAFLNSSMYCKE